ncbi:hypothetical protein [Flavobacterium cerinum]|uniref:Uncharacterized protein n=1 Tax=Flavobacterium cerinum TaxID=2502784 RepID=A0A444HFY9_9FLAO|nr:hypothetical protein [Flavobacterium cerinum]RWX03804.1 hypothetical protein EPI11_02400 [Flavobacterium cerinum]
MIETKEDGSITTFTYTYDGSKIVSIIRTDGISDIYAYTGNLITYIKHTNTYFTSETFIEYDNNNRKIIEKTFNTILQPNVVLEKIDMVTFSYSPNGTVTSSVYVGDSESEMELNNSSTITYNNGNTISFETTSGLGNYDHIYDTKNNSMKNVLGYHEYMRPDYDGKHNCLTAYTKPEGAIYTFTYTYNLANYPETSTLKGKRLDGEYVTTKKQYFYE